MVAPWRGGSIKDHGVGAGNQRWRGLTRQGPFQAPDRGLSGGVDYALLARRIGREQRREMTMSNVAVWFEIPAKDLDRAVGFYERILGARLKRETTAGTT